MIRTISHKEKISFLLVFIDIELKQGSYASYILTCGSKLKLNIYPLTHFSTLCTTKLEIRRKSFQNLFSTVSLDISQKAKK